MIQIQELIWRLKYREIKDTKKWKILSYTCAPTKETNKLPEIILSKKIHTDIQVNSAYRDTDNFTYILYDKKYQMFARFMWILSLNHINYSKCSSSALLLLAAHCTKTLYLHNIWGTISAKYFRQFLGITWLTWRF